MVLSDGARFEPGASKEDALSTSPTPPGQNGGSHFVKIYSHKARNKDSNMSSGIMGKFESNSKLSLLINHKGDKNGRRFKRKSRAERTTEGCT